MVTVGPRDSGVSENIIMWFRVLVLVSVATALAHAHGTYRLIDPRLVPGWLERFPNSRILLNRYNFDYLYRRLILRDPYWYRRINMYRQMYPYLFNRPRYINHIHTRRNIGILSPRILATRSVRVQPAPYVRSLRVNRFPVRAAVQTTSLRSNAPMVGGSSTFVRYSSPTIAKYNTPWSRISSSYKNYGQAESSPLYDRPEFGGGAVGLEDGFSSSDAGFLEGSLGAAGQDFGGFPEGAIDSGFSSAGFQFGGGLSTDDAYTTGGGYANEYGYLGGSEVYQGDSNEYGYLGGSEVYQGDSNGPYYSSSSEGSIGYDEEPKAVLRQDVF
ncbi:uncharacterized protein LOC125646325 [Ostrea edulis]|uniref:uncharacterized protein LOC125646325 n=1 Tax=Ostrea edulis TaxID=37623 RepID=UPI0024AF82F3|nr:uncharacterized protein LOC125646325 [Ostrea edulis]